MKIGILKCAISALECKQLHRIMRRRLLGILFGMTAADADSVGIQINLHTKGFVVINGFNIGRYWDKGPQRTLYVPGGLLKEKDNVIEIFDVKYDGKKQIVSFIDHSILEGNN